MPPAAQTRDLPRSDLLSDGSVTYFLVFHSGQEVMKGFWRLSDAGTRTDHIPKPLRRTIDREAALSLLDP